MVEQKELLPIDPRSITYLPATAISNPEIVALGRGDYAGIAFVYVCSASSGLRRSKEIADGASRQGSYKGVVGLDINKAESFSQRKPIYNHQSLGLWSEIKFIPHVLREFTDFIHKEGRYV